MRDEFYMYWLSTLFRLGTRKQNQLLEYFGTARQVFDAPSEVLGNVPGFTANNVHVVLQNREISAVNESFKALERLRIRFISRCHEDFPSLLAEIPDPPVGIYCLGELPPNDKPSVAVIGSRRCSEYGLTIARMFSSKLAAHGVVIVSGMARGIDSMAHRGALESGGHTIAVLGCGADICYPAENRALRDDIARTGSIISEYPPGVNPVPAYFPARNRIISGLCKVILVVEAGIKSGTQITVEQALDQGRDIMAVPGNITGKYSEGTNNLIKQGAEPAACYEDVLQMLGIHPENLSKESVTRKTDHIAPEEKLVYDTLAFEPITFDEILTRTNSRPQTAQYLLTMLELKGYVQKLPGMRYIRRA